MKDAPKWAEYALLIRSKFAEIFDPESENPMDIRDFDSEENIQAFFHAMATVVPCEFFNKILGENKNHVEFNHTANLLCFQFVKILGKE